MNKELFKALASKMVDQNNVATVVEVLSESEAFSSEEFRTECNSECSSYRLRFCYNNKVCYINNIALIARDYICQNKLVLVFNSPEDMESALEECAILDYDNDPITELIPGVRMGIAFRIKLPVGTSIGIESVC